MTDSEVNRNVPIAENDIHSPRSMKIQQQIEAIRLKGKLQLSYEKPNEYPDAVLQSINILIYMSRNSITVMPTEAKVV